MTNLFNKSAIILGAVMVLGMVSCQKEYDSPPENNLPVGSVITLDSLRNMYEGDRLTITEDLSVYCTVTMDEADGNIYKGLYVEDETGAINLRTLFAGAAYEGDYIRLALKGTVMSDYNGVIQLDSVDGDKNVIVQESEKHWTPNKLSLTEALSLGVLLESQLVEIDSVQFLTEQLGETYADAKNQSSVNRTLVDCNGNQIIVRTSGFADFAGEELVEGKGKFVGIMNHYRGELQLLIRSYDELVDNMSSGERCDDGTYRSISKSTFDGTDLSEEGWTTQAVSGPYLWTISEFSGERYAYMSNWDGSNNTACETWLISPAFDLTETTAPALQFDYAKNYGGDDIEVLVSTDFTGGSVGSATWTNISPNMGTATGWTWYTAGPVDLSAYKSSSVYVAFKYIGSDTGGRTWEIDNVIVREN